jgi:beta-phosphoglucomutase-like phosphatase (HAD superfamily)
VEDVPAGVEAARRGGMRSIGVSRATRLDADIYVESLDRLPPDAFDRLVPGIKF